MEQFLLELQIALGRMADAVVSVVAVLPQLGTFGEHAVAILLAFVVFLFLLPLIPGGVDLLTNKPNRHGEKGRKSTFGFFTYLQPGRVKIIERGDRFMHAVMRYPGHMFLGERPDNNLIPRQKEYWEVVETREKDRDSPPILPPWKKWKGIRRWRWLLYSPISILWYFWKEWVYLITGAVFTGVWPFQKVRVYQMTKYLITTNEESGAIKLVKKTDWSDHYRVVHFQFPALVPEADTRDKIAVSVIVNVIGQVRNPYEVAYYTDEDWPSRLLAAISDAVISFTRSRPLDEVLTASPDTVVEMSNHIKSIGRERREKEAGPIGSAFDFGIELPTPPQILDVSPENRKHRDRLGDLAFAIIERDAAKERAKGVAAPVREIGKALRKYPEATIVPEIEGRVRSAAEAGKSGGFVIVPSGGQPIDPMQVALLQALQRFGERPRNNRGGTAPSQIGGGEP